MPRATAAPMRRANVRVDTVICEVGAKAWAKALVCRHARDVEARELRVEVRVEQECATIFSTSLDGAYDIRDLERGEGEQRTDCSEPDAVAVYSDLPCRCNDCALRAFHLRRGILATRAGSLTRGGLMNDASRFVKHPSRPRCGLCGTGCAQRAGANGRCVRSIAILRRQHWRWRSIAIGYLQLSLEPFGLTLCMRNRGDSENECGECGDPRDCRS